ncbi:methylenetetrahydrofolate reductase [Aeromicrobium sp. CTD01-1L150]|uniref:methylenetetrahydrofolate reductase n=1 Tax=Aeromicrobium sp. CTD01-1L150 TaxID=3341830 RepID=UPI0035C1B64C
MHKVVDRMRDGEGPAFSVEFFPPRDEADEEVLWRSVRQLEPLDPAYMSITYGAGGHSREGTVRSIARAATDTTLVPMAHLTAVNHSVAELRQVIGEFAGVGVHNILALRGDPPGDIMGEWTPHPDGLHHAHELVELIHELGDFCVGVAAFPYGHPRSDDLDLDTKYLVHKLRAGADFAVTQLFFEADDFLRLRDRVTDQGCDAMLIPGVMPLTTPRTLRKSIELSGTTAPTWLLDRLEPLVDDPAAFRAEGMDIVTELSQRLIDEGVPGLHFYTFNRAKATRELVARLGLR